MSEELSNIQKLIRLKRYEQPPEGYFEDFLLEFQRRQRAEMLQRPLWQLAWERANLWLESFRVPALAYASIVAVAIAGAGIMMKPAGSTRAIAANGGSVDVVSTAPLNPVAPVSTGNGSSYVLEKRPVSYDAPFSF
jgi:hypothetical protein